VRSATRTRRRAAVLGILLAALVPLFLAGCGAPEAARLVGNWSIKPVADTYDITPAGKPAPPQFSLDAGRLIYLSGDSRTYGVLLWEDSTGRRRQVGENADPAVPPEIKGDYGLWWTKVGTQPQLVLRQLKFGVSRTFDAAAAQSIDRHLSADCAVYTQPGEGNATTVMAFDLAAVTSKVVAHTPFGSTGPAADGRRVVWVGDDAGHPELFLRDLSTGKITQLTQNSLYSKYGVRVSGDLVSWTEGSGRTVDFYVLNLGNGKVTHLGSSDNSAASPRWFPRRAVPQTDGRYVVWERSAGGRWQVILYDSSNEKTRVLSSAGSDRDFDPKLGDGFVAFEHYSDVDGTTYSTVAVFDLAKGTTTQLSEDGRDAVWPEVSGKQVAWWEYDRTGSEPVRRLVLATRQ
jgi:Tol biopolymer transport system component